MHLVGSRTAILIGVLYSVIGIVFALPTNHVRMWRLAAWVVSAIVFAAHIAYEHFRLGNSPRATALHTALAVAVGAFGLAVARIFTRYGLHQATGAHSQWSSWHGR